MNKKTMQNNVKSLDKDLANCEYYLSRVLKLRSKESEKPSTTNRPDNKLGQNLKDMKSRAGLKSVPGLKMNQTNLTKPRQVPSIISSSKSNLNTNRTDSSVKGQKRLVHKETFNNAATVEVTVKTKKPEYIKPRSNSISKESHIDPEANYQIDKEFELTNKCSHHCKEKQKESNTLHKNPSWGQLLQAYKFQELHRTCKKSSNCSCNVNKHDTPTDIPEKTEKVPTIETLSSRSKSDEALDNAAFSIFDPVRTVNFLFKELTSKLNKNPRGDSETNKILINIEHTLNRLYSDRDNSRHINTVTENLNDSPPSPLQHSPLKMHEYQEERPVLLLPERTNHKTITTQTSMTEIQPPKDTFRSTFETDMANAVVQRLQESCEKLEATCSEMKATCEELKQEKAELKEELEMRNHQLEAVRLKEKEYSKILETFKQNFNNMTKKSEEYLKTISKLTIENNKLNENIKSMDELQSTNNQLSLRIKELELFNEKLETELQIFKLEKEKYKFILERKESEISRFKGDIGNINSFLQNHLTDRENLKYVDEDNKSNSTLGSNIPENKKIICSSPTGSPGTPELYDSWHILSKISPEIASKQSISNNKEQGIVGEEQRRFSTIHEVDSDVHTSFEQPNWNGSNNSEYNQSIALTHHNHSDVASDKSCEEFKTLLEGEEPFDIHHAMSESDDSISWKTRASNFDLSETATNRLRYGLEDLLAQFTENLHGATENIVHNV